MRSEFFVIFFDQILLNKILTRDGTPRYTVYRYCLPIPNDYETKIMLLNYKHLCLNYENTPMQYTEIFLSSKNGKFSLDFF